MIIILGLLIAFVLVVLFSRPATRRCRWREYREADDSRWTCVYCGAITRGPTGARPTTCFQKKR